MIIILALLAGILFGGGLIGYLLTQRFKQEVESARQDMQSALEQHYAEVEMRKDLQQQVADLKYQLHQAQRDLASQTQNHDAAQ